MKLFSKERRKIKQKAYHSKAWRKLSARFRKQNPLCVRCLARGIYRRSEVADHDNPIWKGRGILTSRLNALCKPCHLDKTIIEDYPKLQVSEKTKMRFF